MYLHLSDPLFLSVVIILRQTLPMQWQTEMATPGFSLHLLSLATLVENSTCFSKGPNIDSHWTLPGQRTYSSTNHYNCG